MGDYIGFDINSYQFKPIQNNSTKNALASDILFLLLQNLLFSPVNLQTENVA